MFYVFVVQFRIVFLFGILVVCVLLYDLCIIRWFIYYFLYVSCFLLYYQFIWDFFVYLMCFGWFINSKYEQVRFGCNQEGFGYFLIIQKQNLGRKIYVIYFQWDLDNLEVYIKGFRFWVINFVIDECYLKILDL